MKQTGIVALTSTDDAPQKFIYVMKYQKICNVKMEIW